MAGKEGGKKEEPGIITEAIGLFAEQILDLPPDLDWTRNRGIIGERQNSKGRLEYLIPGSGKMPTGREEELEWVSHAVYRKWEADITISYFEEKINKHEKKIRNCRDFIEAGEGLMHSRRDRAHIDAISIEREQATLSRAREARDNIASTPEAAKYLKGISKHNYDRLNRTVVTLERKIAAVDDARDALTDPTSGHLVTSWYQTPGDRVRGVKSPSVDVQSVVNEARLKMSYLETDPQYSEWKSKKSEAEGSRNYWIRVIEETSTK